MQNLARRLLAAAIITTLATCSSYQGPITNASPPSGSTGLPGTTRDSAP